MIRIIKTIIKVSVGVIGELIVGEGVLLSEFGGAFWFFVNYSRWAAVGWMVGWPIIVITVFKIIHDIEPVRNKIVSIWNGFWSW